MDYSIAVAIVAGILALLFSFSKFSWIGKQEPGNERMQEISGYINEGAMAFLAREYKSLAIFVVVVFVVLVLFINLPTAICFLFGAACSAVTGYVGMQAATKANVRTANAARESGMTKALNIAFLVEQLWEWLLLV